MAWHFDSDDLLIADNQPLYAHRYIKADYIEFDWTNNTGYIDTGIVDNGQKVWTIEFEWIAYGVDNWVCGTVYHPSGITYSLGTSNGSSYEFTGQYASFTQNLATGVRTTGTKRAWGNYPFTNTIYIGTRNWSSEGATIPSPSNHDPAHFKVYSFSITSGGVQLATMHPAYDTVNQEWGMYDTTRNQFFGNAGGEGTSIAGGYFPQPIDQTPEVLAFDYNDSPASMWTINNEEIIVNGLLPEPLIDYQGAFAECSNLVQIIIPSTLTSIGRYSFRDTDLTEVTLPENCTYYSTSFPQGCVINGGQLIH